MTPAGGSATAQRGTVLVIDQDMRWAIRQILAETGFEVAEACAGAPGIEMAARRAVDAVILDVQMPGIDGDEVLRRLKFQHKDLPVIVVTAHGTIPGAIDAIRTGAFEYITKPFHNEQLPSVVRRAVSRHRALTPPAATDVRNPISSVMGQGGGHCDELFGADLRRNRCGQGTGRAGAA